MKIWVTAPFDDDGIKELETIGRPVGDTFRCTNGFTYINWFKEGVTWHKSKSAAIEAASKLRTERIIAATKEAARLAALPSISARSH